VKDLQTNLLNLAESTEVAPFNAYTPIPTSSLLGSLQQVGDAVANLRPGDSVVYSSHAGRTEVNREFRLLSDQKERLMSDEITSSEATLVLVVKKPDFLGSSRWEFKYDSRTIEAKMLDEKWLRAFQAGAEVVPPRAAILARVRTEMVRSHDGTLTSTRYYVDEVVRVILNFESPDDNLNLSLESDAA
jgi:hypothetical protein